MNTTYPNSLADTEWDYLQRLLPPRSAQSKLRRHSLRSVFAVLYYLVRTGCLWCYLPAHLPLWQTVYNHFRQCSRTGLGVHLYREHHNAKRRRIGKDPPQRSHDGFTVYQDRGGVGPYQWIRCP